MREIGLLLLDYVSKHLWVTYEFMRLTTGAYPSFSIPWPEWTPDQAISFARGIVHSLAEGGSNADLVEKSPAWHELVDYTAIGALSMDYANMEPYSYAKRIVELCYVLYPHDPLGMDGLEYMLFTGAEAVLHRYGEQLLQ